MLDIFLIILIFVTIIGCFLTVKFWKKRNFVKEVTYGEGSSNALLIIDIINTLISLVAYFAVLADVPNPRFLMSILIINLGFLFLYCIDATMCIYIKDKTIIKKNLFFYKQIILNNETIIIEKNVSMIIRYNKKSISIDLRRATGNVRNLIYRVKEIITSSDNSSTTKI